MSAKIYILRVGPCTYHCMPLKGAQRCGLPKSTIAAGSAIEALSRYKVIHRDLIESIRNKPMAVQS